MLLLKILGAIVLVIVSLYEAVHWLECRMDCEEQRSQGEALLHSPLCATSKTASGPCEQTARNLRLSLFACTLRLWWRTSEPYRLYDMIAHSPLTLLATLLALIYVGYQQMKSQV